MNRRKALKVMGGALIVAAGGAGYFAATRTPRRALAPWEEAGAERFVDPRMRALSYAVLAPNPHNRQPWLIELDEQGGLTLRFDQARQLPHTDPFDRQLTIGLGCFLELLKMAANADGYAVDIDLFPEGTDPDGLTSAVVATATFKKDNAIASDPLWSHVMDRRSNKEPFDITKAVKGGDLAN
ncbi:MAG: twin-arginine translocation pathway signal protein, partial [Pseudomonadota bacterium]